VAVKTSAMTAFSYGDMSRPAQSRGTQQKTPPGDSGVVPCEDGEV
jgi:hypothetical protein